MRFLLLAVIPLLVFGDAADDFINATIANEPSTVVDGCVSAVTGAYFINETDCHLHGSEPFSFNRMYVSTSQEGAQPTWELFPHLIAKRPLGRFDIVAKEANGVIVTYRKGAAVVGKGYCHEGDGSMTVANNQLEVRNQGFLLLIADGTVRHYERHKDSRFCKAIDADRIYRMVREVRPNGNVVSFEYDGINPTKIKVTSPDESVTYLSFSIDYVNWHSEGRKMVIHRNFHRHKEKILEYVYERGKCKKVLNFLKRVESFQKPTETISYDRSHIQTPLLVNHRDFTGGQAQQVTHFENKPYGPTLSSVESIQTMLNNRICIAEIARPFGNDSKVAHRFSYGGRKKTVVFDPMGNKTEYELYDDLRPMRVLKYRGDLLYSEFVYNWHASGDLRSKVEMKDGKPYLSTAYSYDEHHNPLEEVVTGDFTGRGEKTQKITTYTWKREHHKNLLAEKCEPEGRITRYEYFKDTNLPSAIQVLVGGQVVREELFSYDKDHLLVEHVVQGGGRKITKKIKPHRGARGMGLPEEIATFAGDQLLGKVRYLYNRDNFPAREEHIDGNEKHLYFIHKEYDRSGRILSQTDPIGRKSEYTYDAHGNQIRVKLGNENFYTTSTYDRLNRPISQTKHTPDYPPYTSRTEYDLLSRPVALFDHQGNATRFCYHKNALETTITLPGPGHPKKHLKMDFLERTIEETDPDGNTTKTEYTALGKPSRIVYADGAQETFLYTPGGNAIASHTLPNGTVISYTYDAFDRPLVKKTINGTERYTYDAFDLLAVTAPDGVTTRFAYDPAGRKISEVIDEKKVTYAYNAQSDLHKVTTFTNANQAQVKKKKFNLLHQVLEESREDLSGKTYGKTSFSYDAFDNVASRVTDGLKTTYTYDSLKRKTSETNTLGQTVTTTYDDFIPGHKKTVFTDLKGRALTTTYDARGNKIRTEVRLGSKTLAKHEYAYSLDGDLTDLTIFAFHPERIIRRHWKYDSRHREITFIDAYKSNEEQVTRSSYTKTGKVATKTKPDGTVIAYSYDALDNNTTIKAPGIHYTYKYDKRGRVVKARDETTGNETTRRYDTYGNVTREKLANGLQMARTFDLIGRTTSITYPDRSKTTYTYDPYHLASLTRNGATVSYHYNQREELTKIDGQEKISYTYDNLSRPVSVESARHKDVIEKYDLTANPLSRTLNGQKHTYAFDDYDHLTKEPEQNYTYDSLHNRTSHNATDASYNALNQNTRHSYDKNGNPTITPEHTYTYDALDRLTKIDDLELTYDPFHRLMTYGNRHILYDGDFDIGTYENKTLTNLRILGPTPLAEIGATALIQLGTLSQPTHDLFGNIHTIENHRLSYGAYGSVCTNTPTPWQYQGKRAIGHLIYFGKRFYSPDEGRFLTPDPLGYVDAPNLYHYLLSSPLAHHDPWGLTAISLTPDSYRALVALGWAARVIAPYTGPIGMGIAVGTAAVYTGYKLYSHYKENEIIDKQSKERYNPRGITFKRDVFTSTTQQIGEKGQVATRQKTTDVYVPDRPLPLTEHGVPLPETDAPHTELGTKQGRKGKYPQAREFDGKGKPVKDIDFTDHGTPKKHPNPHQHPRKDNPTGGTRSREDAEPLPGWKYL